MNFPRRYRPARAFTLIEILIIAALIAILSGIAVISIQYLVLESKRKATLGDLRTVAHAMTLATYDHGFYPGVAYMTLTEIELRQLGGSTDPNAVQKLPPNFHANGFNTFSQAAGQDPFAARVLRNWNGPYFPKPTGRSLISTSGVGYLVRMRMPSSDSNNPVILDWPADPFGNPLVVYLVHFEINESTGQVEYSQASLTREPNYVAIAVSYGPNRIPGGSQDGVSSDIRQAAEEFRLFEDDGSGIADAQGTARFVALLPSEIIVNGIERWRALGREVSPLDGYGYLSAYPDVPGIRDVGSDDLFVPIP